MKKVVMTLLCIVLVMTTLAGCAKAPEEATKEAVKETPAKDTEKSSNDEKVSIADEKEKITLKIAMWEPYDEMKSHVIVSKKYTELTGVEFEWICVTDGYDQKMMTATQGGDAPDLIQFWNTPQYAEAGIVQDLTPLVKRDNYSPDGKYGIAEGFEQYKGKYYGLTTEATPRAIYYNKDVFDAYGVAYPQDGWTWDEFYETAKALTGGSGDEQTYGYVALAGHTYLLQQYVWSNGGDLISDDGTTTIGYMDSEPVKEVIEWYKSLYDISAQVIQGDTAKNLGEAEFMSGKVAMMDNGVWPTWKLKEAGINYGIVSPPVPNKGDDFYPVVHSGCYGISVNTEYTEECWEFIKFIQSEEGQAAYAITSLPIQYDASVVAGQLEDEHLAPFVELLARPTYKAPCFMRSNTWWEADAVFATAVEQILLSDADIDTTLKEAAAYANDIVSSN